VSAVDRARPPAGGSPRSFRFPEFSRERLPNGLELVLAPRAGVPLVEILLQVPAGAERNPLGRSGLASLTASLVDEGTATRSGPEIASAVERLGGSLSSRADWNAAEIDVGLLAPDLATGIELVAEVARRPTFPAAEVERLRRQTQAELLRRRDQPAILAEEAMARALYPGTAYGFLLFGDDASVAGLGRDEIAAFHAECYRPQGASLLVAGEIDPAAARSLVEDALGDWRAPAPAAPPEIVPAASRGRRVVIVDRPAAAQTELRLAQPGVPRTHPDRTRLGLLNALLGGKFTSRLNLNLRERHGFTYGANSRFVDRRGPGPFVVSAAVGNAVAGAAAREALGELERLTAETPSETEVEESKSYLLGVFPYTLQTSSDVLSRLAELTLWGLPDDHYPRALAQVAATTAADLRELAARHLRPQELVVLAVGPAAELEPQLAPLGTLERLEI
jgi:zinc protease